MATPKNLISIDIGSTYTKGAVFSLAENGRLSFRFREESPTTPDDLTRCFYRVKNALLAKLEDTSHVEVFYSSSAKGGLSVVALGVVPELTLQMAKLTAYSAGAKISKVFAYRLKVSDLKKIEELRPDIIFFSGGTDGGNEAIVLHNAEMLARLKKGPVIIYAGNSALSDDILEILKAHEVVITENVLPDLDHPNPEPARELIREIFLKQITVNKGISKIMEKENRNPFPTPYSVYEYIKILAEKQSEDERAENPFARFALVDMGGATTDFYSYVAGYQPGCQPGLVGGMETEENVIMRGVREPDAKRTVEGDLGMRINALSCFEQATPVFERQADPAFREKFYQYVLRVSKNIEARPQNEEEQNFDQLLARICYFLAMRRHSGERQTVFTAQGPAYLQKGKDLRSVNALIMTGGWLSRQKSKELFVGGDVFFEDLKQEGRCALVPQIQRYFVDQEYIIPLLANLHEKYSDAIVQFTYEYLKELT